jgi:sec-independent protein translocase protein TatB
VFDITPLKILIVLLVALVVLGPERLPGMAHQVARGWGDFRRFRDHVESEVRDTMAGERSTRPAAANASAPSPPAEGDGGEPELPGRGGEEREQHHPGLN